MFDRFFKFIRQGVKNAILGGVSDAQDVLTQKIEDNEPLLIEAEPINGKPKGKRKTTTAR